MKDTRRKLLQTRSGEFNERLNQVKDQYAREKGLDMPDDQLRRVTKQVKKDIVSDEEVRKYRDRTNLLENRLKNIVIRQIVQIRKERQKPRIKEAVEAIIQKNRAEKDRKHRKVEKMVKHQLEDQAAADMERNDGQEKDILYNRVIVNMKRLLKVLTGHSNAIDSLERKLKAI